MHISVDAETGQILASELTSNKVDDGSQVEPLLDQITAPLASLTGDGAYDQAGIYCTVGKHHPDADVIVPPRSTAVLSEDVVTTPTQRDRHLQSIAEHGRISWQKQSGYTRRALVESAISRLKRVIGGALLSRTKQRRLTEVAIAVHALNRMLELGARSPPVSPKFGLRARSMRAQSDPCNSVAMMRYKADWSPPPRSDSVSTEDRSRGGLQGHQHHDPAWHAHVPPHHLSLHVRGSTRPTSEIRTKAPGEPIRTVVVDAALNDTHDGLIRLLGDTQRFGFGLEALTLRDGTGSTAVVAIILSVPVEIDEQLVAARLARHPAVRSIHALLQYRPG